MKHPIFPLRRLAIVIATIYAPTALAAAGRIEFAVGEPVVVGGDGRERPARKGEPINPGDRILTRAGRAQLAFTDGAFISLQPNTDFGVDEYVFKGSNDGSEKSVFSLLKGALRTVTGLVGRSRRDAYTMNTPTATIGIRGTGGQIEVNSEGTFVRGTSGTWLLTNQGGTLNVPAGSSGFAGLDNKKTPEQSSTAPNTPPASSGGAGPTLSTQPYSAGDQIGAVTLPATTKKLAMTDGAGYAVNIANTDGVFLLNPSVTATFDADTGSVLKGFGNYSIGTAQALETGNDGVIGWGRWTNGTATINGAATPLNANQGMHYVVGIPTAVMPTTGVANYSLLGASKPTVQNGAVAPGTFTLSSMSVNFGTGQYNLAFGVNINSMNYTASKVGGSLSANGFSDTLTMGGCYTVTCSGSVKGTFFGTSAQRLGINYSINDSMGGLPFVGAAVLQKP